MKKFAQDKIVEMNNLYYFLAGGLFILWFLGYMILNVGGAVHFIFLMAVAVLIYKLVKEFNNTKQ